MVTLGQTYTDSITGFSGTATGRAEYLNGCTRVLLEALESGKPAEYWFDEQRLDTTSQAEAGGPSAAPPARDPHR